MIKVNSLYRYISADYFLITSEKLEPTDQAIRLEWDEISVKRIVMMCYLFT